MLACVDTLASVSVTEIVPASVDDIILLFTITTLVSVIDIIPPSVTPPP